MTPWAVAHQAPLPVGFSRREHWRGLPCPPPGDLPHPGIEAWSPALQADSLASKPPNKPTIEYTCVYIYIHTHACICHKSYICVLCIDTHTHIYTHTYIHAMDFEVVNPCINLGDPSLIPGLGRSPGGGNDNPLQYSCLENPMDRGSWCGTVHGVTESQTSVQ